MAHDFLPQNFSFEKFSLILLFSLWYFINAWEVESGCCVICNLSYQSLKLRWECDTQGHYTFGQLGNSMKQLCDNLAPNQFNSIRSFHKAMTSVGVFIHWRFSLCAEKGNCAIRWYSRMKLANCQLFLRIQVRRGWLTQKHQQILTMETHQPKFHKLDLMVICP